MVAERILGPERPQILRRQGQNDRLRVGGPATAKNQWIREFVAFCAEHELPADFISRHHYPTDVVEGTSLGDEMDLTETQLARSRRSIMREWGFGHLWRVDV